MALTRLDTTLARLDSLAAAVAATAGPVALRCRDADTVMMAAALRGRLERPVGVWLEVSSGYRASLAARDVATLAWLIDLDLVVVSASSDAPSHADVVAALLTNDEVNFSNEVAVIAGAYNRPAPPRPVEVWSFDGTQLRGPDTVLHETSNATSDDVTATTYAS
jgi:hypothetical protein